MIRKHIFIGTTNTLQLKNDIWNKWKLFRIPAEIYIRPSSISNQSDWILYSLKPSTCVFLEHPNHSKTYRTWVVNLTVIV